jgi:hypothetical protein
VERLPLAKCIEQLDARTESFVLVRNRCFLERIVQDLIARAVPFIAEGGGVVSPLDEQGVVFAAVTTAHALQRGESVSALALRKMLDFVPTRGGALLPHGLKRLLESYGDVVLSYETIMHLLGTGHLLDVIRTAGPLAALPNLNPDIARYVTRVIQKHGYLLEPKIRLTTIHGSKGRGRDVVVLVPDMTKATFIESLDGRHGGAEAENRVAYVGVTRTKKRLIIADASNESAYQYPR